MHRGAFEFVRHELSTLPPRRSVVEFGSRDINGSVRKLFDGAQYVGIDMRPGAGVDVVADAASFALSEPVDCVVCCEVLEHTPDGAAIVANAYRLLTPDGVFIATMATDPRAPHSALDGGHLRARNHEYYGNVSLDQLRDWLKLAGFRPRDHLTFGGDQRHGDLYVSIQKGDASA